MATMSGLANFKTFTVDVTTGANIALYTPTRDCLVFVSINAFQNQSINGQDGHIFWYSRSDGEPSFPPKRHLMYGNVSTFQAEFGYWAVYNGPFVPAGATIRCQNLYNGPNYVRVYFYVFELDTDAQNIPNLN
jgi:hypothetical protein